MKIDIEFFNSKRYKEFKRELQDPEMEMDELQLTVRFNDFGDEIILEEADGRHDIIRFETAKTYTGIYFANGNCIEFFHEDATVEVKFI